MTTGYQPAFAFIGRQPVFIEGRGGNTSAAYRMDETLEKCFDGLKANNIHIEHFRSDSAAYQKDIVDVADTPFFPFGGKQSYRAVVQRRKRKDGQHDMFTQSPYTYYAVITNNETLQADNEYVTNFYNERGDDLLNNDFNLNRLSLFLS